MSSSKKFDVTQLRYEIMFFALISGSITALLTITDIIIFDNYVKPIMSECHDANISAFCDEMRIKLEVPLGDQLEFGSKYWDVLQSHFYVLGITMLLIRICTPVIFKPKPEKGSKWKRIFFVMGAIWFAGTIIWFFFGALDTGYYFLRGEFEIPDELPWLNEAGLFTLVKSLTGTENVDEIELYILNILGFVVFGILWLTVYFVKKKYASQLSLF